MGRLVVGISTENDMPEKIAVKKRYVNAVIQAGGIPLLLPFTDNVEVLRSVVSLIDGLLLIGGDDVSPFLYGESPIAGCFLISQERDTFDYTLLRLACKRQIPVFGICRGLQVINVYFGGTLYQDLPTQFPSDVCHKSQSPDKVSQHRIHCLENSILHTATGKEYLDVSSTHHQAVKELANGFTATAFADDGVIEAIESDSNSVWGVQFHPELSIPDNHEDMQQIFSYFITQMKLKKERRYHGNPNSASMYG
ncbi:gamma-glutamyl-gamma-aminobutyrate hydrolase family protein [Proteiniphilum sp.]|uniref:gamma-glutamyl-gamma-aminobutyrate hydrolase family protein n=1 Tax=Proteiniphilum sp. TaxID=1926877 RepID=UPI002B2045B2|nr:gamma-glutamyl-gamma-aminobutyrate hydrolase family protein [Proteiniphilum sp.]MEA4919100.1 gamma-glutamyl-gamma-aminobutyrate hydrolase family protein [Proteiniphilum sp.]